jgi:hypothetical protein
MSKITTVVAGCYVCAIALSAGLILAGEPPERAALPAFLIWMLIHRAANRR